MKKRSGFYLTGALAAVLVAAAVSLAAVPQTINYQGYLADSGGTPVNATVPMQFSLYSSPTSSNALWTESHPNVQVSQGRYSVVLGNGSPTAVPINLPFDVPYYLGVKVGSDAEMTPRLPLTSVGYARMAGSVSDGAITAAKIGENCANGEFLVKSPNGWSCGSISLPPNAIGLCVQNSCQLNCSFGWGNCDNNTANGCKTDLQNDPNNCGSCGNICPSGQICTNGACAAGAPCPSGMSRCNYNTCVNLQYDPINCGSCGNICPSGQICTNGACAGTAVQYLVFVSSQLYNGNLGGLAGADSKCQALATRAGLPGVYKAWLSDSSSSPFTRFTHPQAPYEDTKGNLIALNWTELTAGGNLRRGIVYTESGDDVGGVNGTVAWTATSQQGTLNAPHCSPPYLSYCDCVDWTEDQSYTGECGQAWWSYTNHYWTDAFNQGCSQIARLYCFQQ